MHSLMARLPMTTGDVDGAAAEVYLDVLAGCLSEGKIIEDESKQLARLAGDAGQQVSALNERLVEAMREPPWRTRVHAGRTARTDGGSEATGGTGGTSAT